LVTFDEGPGTSPLRAIPESAGRPTPKPLRGAMRLLEAMGHGTLTEFPLKSGRRADILSLGAKGEIWIVEVKSGVPDFRSDHKWQDYLEWCDRFFFAVGPAFPTHILPADAGLLIADEYEAVLEREPETISSCKPPQGSHAALRTPRRTAAFGTRRSYSRLLKWVECPRYPPGFN
jgi:hypothetical protein